jgi:RNase P/RNase MRP subunit POP5
VLPVDNEQWYSQKEIFEMLQGLKVEITDFRQEIRNMVDTKNHEIETEVSNIKARLTEIETTIATKTGIARSTRDWMLFVLAALGMIVNFLNMAGVFK